MLSSHKAPLSSAVAVALWAAGCGGHPNPPPPPPPADMEVGTAATDGTGFLPLSGTVSMVPGAQGGFHVWLKYRMKGVSPGTLTTKHTAHRVSDGHLVSLGSRVDDVGTPDADGWWETPNATPNFLCPTPIGVNVIGEALQFEVDVTDEQGDPVCSATATATVECPAAELAFCQQICAG